MAKFGEVLEDNYYLDVDGMKRSGRRVGAAVDAPANVPSGYPKPLPTVPAPSAAQLMAEFDSCRKYQQSNFQEPSSEELDLPPPGQSEGKAPPFTEPGPSKATNSLIFNASSQGKTPSFSRKDTISSETGFEGVSRDERLLRWR